MTRTNAVGGAPPSAAATPAPPSTAAASAPPAASVPAAAAAYRSAWSHHNHVALRHDSGPTSTAASAHSGWLAAPSF